MEFFDFYVKVLLIDFEFQSKVLELGGQYAHNILLDLIVGLLFRLRIFQFLEVLFALFDRFGNFPGYVEYLILKLLLLFFIGIKTNSQPLGLQLFE